MTPLVFPQGVLLVGGGDVDAGAIDIALQHTGHVVAADGAADSLASFNLRPDAIIGDMDSIDDLAAWSGKGAAVVRLEEQDTTDFEKCLYSTAAPLYIGVGFTGRRFDHTLAALHTMLRHAAKRVLLIGAEDVIYIAPEQWSATLPPGARVSFFPLRPVRGLASSGLEWPIDGLAFEIGCRVGTSNRARGGRVSASFDGIGVAVMVERQYLAEALAGLLPAPA